MSAPRRPVLWAGALLVVAAVVFLAPALFSGKVLAGDDLLLVQPPEQSSAPPGFERPANPLAFDSAYVFHPDQIEARRQMRAGHLPAWSPRIGGGRSLLASQQTAPLYPATWLSYVLDFWSSLEWIALLKLLGAGGGMLVLLRHARLGWPAAAFGAVAFMLSTYLLLWLAHPHSNVYVLAPWLMAFGARAAAGGRLGDAAAFAGFVALATLGGHPGTVLLVGTLLVAPWTLAALLRERPALGRRVALLAGATALGLLAGAVMLFPFVEALGVSGASADRGGRVLPLQALQSFAFPELWGRPGVADLPSGALNAPDLNFQERTGYFGAIALLLALGGLVARRPSRPQVVLAATAAAAALLVFVSPLSQAVAAVPGFEETNLIRALFVVGLCGTALAAFGVQALLDGDRRAGLRFLAAVAAVGVLVPLQWVVRTPEALDALGSAIRTLPGLSPADSAPDIVRMSEVAGWTLLALATIAAAAVAVWRPRFALAGVAVLLALTVIDSVAVGRYIPMVDRDRVDVARGEALDLFAARAREGERSAAEGTMMGPNLADRWATLDARAHVLPTVARYNDLWLNLGGTALGGLTAQRSQIDVTPATDRLLDAFSVRWLLSFDVLGPERAYRRETGVRDWPVWENTDVHPRARVVTSWRPAESKLAGLIVAKAATAAQLRDVPAIERAAPAPGGRPARARAASVQDVSPTEVRVVADAPRPGYVVLNDVVYPGWKAEVDGEEAEIVPANVAFRAVKVPAGRHEVVFEYASAAVRWGVVVSVVAWLAIAAALLAAGIARGRGRPA